MTNVQTPQNEQKTTIKVRNLTIGSILEGKVISKKKGELFVDLSPFGVGRLYGIFYLQSKDLAQKLKVGDTVGVQIVGFDDGYGNLEILLKDTIQIDKWQKILDCFYNRTILELEVLEANRGGLIVEVEGIKGFVPVSQLSPEYYPRVTNKEAILEHLKKFVGKKMQFRILIAEPAKNKLVLSEKLAKEEVYKEVLSKFIVGQIVDVKVVGYSPFGIFVRFHEDPPMDGLIHISEIPSELSGDLEKNFPLGKVFKAKIIQIKPDKVNFTLKDLTPDPWTVIDSIYKVGSLVKGLVEDKNDIYGVVKVNVGEMGSVQGLIFEELGSLDIGKEYDFVIESLNPKERNLILKLPS